MGAASAAAAVAVAIAAGQLQGAVDAAQMSGGTEGRALKPGQAAIDYVVKKYDLDTSAMLGGKPFYNPLQVNAEGLTRPFRLVTIGKPAFASETYLASVIGHEAVHARQWLHPAQAIAMGRAGREIQATQWMLDNAGWIGNPPSEIAAFEGYRDYWESRR
jgi:hypothetical protein